MAKKYSAAEKKSYKRGFLAGLFKGKKKTSHKKKGAVKQSSKNVVKKNYQHNVLFDDSRYKQIYRAQADVTGYSTDETRDIALSLFKKRYGTKALEDHYGKGYTFES